jgi:hypothetical protein
MFRTLIVALLVAVAVNGASSFYMIWHLDAGIEEARRQASSHVRSTKTDFNATNQDIFSQIGTIADNMTSYANEFRGHISEYLVDREASASDFGAIKNRLDAIGLSDVEMFSSLDDQGQRLNLTDTNIAFFQDLMAEVNTKLLELEADLESSRIMDGVHEVVDAYEEKDVYEELTNLQPCVALPINRDEQASLLQAAVGNSRTAGVHDVTVFFDIATDGSTILRNMESPTAPSRLRSAVSRYINGLRFHEREDLLHGCEMVVKLDIRHE